MIQIISGITTSLLIVILTLFILKNIPAKYFAASILCSIAFIYVGFSLLGNKAHSIILESSVAAGFYFIALIGYFKNESIIAYGILLHGAWDLLHMKDRMIFTSVPDYWPLYCMVTDAILGIYFILRIKPERGELPKYPLHR